MADSFASHWRKALALDRRTAPEFYTSPSDVEPGPHADAVRFALSDLGLAAVFCIEGVPTIGFLNEPDVSLAQIDELHRVLWNQGLMSLLLVLKEDELVAYSLVQRPFQRQEGQQNDPRLIVTLSLLSDALKLRELIDSTESGRFWFENDSFFDPDDRVDSVLLSNLLEAFRDMRGDLGGEAAQALLMQTMFIAYLEDRKIIKEAVFRDASDKTCSSLAEMLEANSPIHFETLFIWLKNAFNGNLFNAPCAFETGDATPPKLAVQHLRILARFRHGREEMASGQLRLWGYDFRYMSIGLISAVYDRFLKEEAEKKSADGAFYTPMFLADVVVNQLWDDLSDEQRAKGVFCDPACGSGIFLVRLFQRLVAHHCRIKNKTHAAWNELKSIARRLHGGDINPSAVRVAAFSLYIALLEQSNPPDLPALLKAGKLLPSLYGETLLPASDFFTVADLPKFDAVVGNPPWKGRSGQVTTAQTWAKSNGYPNPAKDIAWAFIWKALMVVKPDGLVAFLLPAMGVLHNTSQEAQDARRRLLHDARVRRIVNLSDLCFQLFDGAQRPTAFVLYAPAASDQRPYRFEYWVPKADLNLRLKRMMTLSRADRLHFRSDLMGEDTTLFKRRLWTRGPEETLLQYLRTIPSLNTFIKEYKEVRKAKATVDRKTDWVIGQGFKPAQEDRLNDPVYDTTTAEIVTRFPYLNARTFGPIALPTIGSSAWSTATVHRAGFAEGFVGPHILIPQGVERSIGRVRAAYSEQSLVFQHSIQAIAFPKTEKRSAKVLTAVLNSSLAAWVYFHDTANLGADRAKVHQGELLKLPFDAPENMPDPARAVIAEEKIVQLIDREIAKADELLSVQSDPLNEIDQLVFDYYGLDAHETALIDDTFRYIIPAMQPRRSAGLQKIWASSKHEHRADYASTLCDALAPCFRQPLQASLAAKSGDVAILKLTIHATSDGYTEEASPDVGQFLQSIQAHLPVRLPGNVQVVPDLRFVIGSDMYLVKPMQLRHWMKSTALADAEQIAAEFTAAIARHGRTGGDYAGR
ncbi:HsdM family class I SAM-dependent methyltransferase [Novacetimonas pomaceti]|uniref:site-specific DNA-methyltransferase (adenine-specific) n=1 Tax=Novacetimonas pomaceti TaxID=2021998 RepID=A0ABX5NY53_9PROT|nr:N-6 DNA methylase [Novacetimonas pomaceti]PYD46370.1 N-6 DNA methylase [Novacetimonas pomaceti]